MLTDAHPLEQRARAEAARFFRDKPKLAADPPATGCGSGSTTPGGIR